MSTTKRTGTSDERVRELTGRGWDEWFEWLSAHGADDLDHRAIVSLLAGEGELPSSWWRQSVTSQFEQHIGRRRPGLTSDGTFQIGARRTYRSNPTRTWRLLAAPEGAAAWLGDTPDPWWSNHEDGPVRGDVLETSTGERYEVRSVTPGTRIRLRTLGPRLAQTTIQLTVIPERGRTIVALHQEGIAQEHLREPMREHWKRALDRIGVLLDDG